MEISSCVAPLTSNDISASGSCTKLGAKTPLQVCKIDTRGLRMLAICCAKVNLPLERQTIKHPERVDSPTPP